VSAVQKQQNVERVLVALKEYGINARLMGIAAKDIVEGNRNKTLNLLWQLALKWVVNDINPYILKTEVDRIVTLHKAEGRLL